MNKIRAILFDMDGLMIDSEIVRGESFRKIILKYGGKVKERIPQVIAVRVLDNWKILKEKYALQLEVEELMEEGESEYTRLIEKSTPIAMPGLFELVDYLRKNNYKRAVVSSAGLFHIKIKLEKLKLNDCFKVVVSGDMLKKGKPDPEGYLMAASKLGVNSKNCLVLEDAPSGISAAKSAGMMCAAIPSTYIRNGDFSKADWILNNLEEVIPILEFSKQ